MCQWSVLKILGLLSTWLAVPWNLSVLRHALIHSFLGWLIDPIISPQNIGLPQDSSISHYSWNRFWSPPRSLLTPLASSSTVLHQVFLLASSSTVLHQVFLSLPLPRLPWGFHSRDWLAMSSDSFRRICPNYPHLHFLICKSFLGCFVRFHSFYSQSGPARKFSIFPLGTY